MDSDMGEVLKKARIWLSADPDPASRQQLRMLIEQGRELDIYAMFHGGLRFGTSGIRGIFGAGPNRMNRLTVRLVTAGIASVLSERVPKAEQRGVVVGFDSRILSQSFANEVCCTLSGYGFRTITFPQPEPTPLLAFTILELRAAAGVMLTASHNPPAYHGLKVYWENGALIIPPIDEEISLAVDKIVNPAEIPLISMDHASRLGLLRKPPAELEELYLDKLRQGMVPTAQDLPLTQPRIVYTALHGVGGRLTQKALMRHGFEDVKIVAEQHLPDGRFPTISDPNPENLDALSIALAYAKREKAALVLATDPDGDRLAVAARNPQGEYTVLNGDEVGILLGHYILDTKQHEGSLPSRGFIVTTIVSSALLERIANRFGVRCERTLTGFKWMWNRALELEKEGWTFVFAYEEAIGYSVNNIVHDKDGISAAVLVANLARHCECDGITILDRLTEIYQSYGLSCTKQMSLSIDAHEAFSRIGSVLDVLKASPPNRLVGSDLQELIDLRSQDVTSPNLNVPRSDVIQLLYGSGLHISVRPSGTESKLKLYFELLRDLAPEDSAAALWPKARDLLENYSNEFIVSLNLSLHAHSEERRKW